MKGERYMIFEDVRVFFEDIHSFCRDEFESRYSLSFDFPSHIHRSFELHIQIEGQNCFTVDGKDYILSPGDAVLTFPYQYHSLKKITDGKLLTFFFSPDIVEDYYKPGRIPKDNKMKFEWNENIETDTPYLRRALAYYICGTFDKGREYVEHTETHDDILTTVLLWADEHFTGDCLLQDAASAIGYNYTYVSKLFKKKLGVTFNQYINLLRVQKSEFLLTSSDKNITEIAHECGFNSLRAFNRKFSEILGTTPSDYRKSSSPKKYKIILGERKKTNA